MSGFPLIMGPTMTTNPNNPFVLPGLGQTGEMASNPLFASLEMMRQTFTSLSGANGLTKGLAMQPTLDPAELEKKINELKSVESWLKLNLSMLSSTIQGMEVQLATIATLQQFMTASQGVATQESVSEPKAASKGQPNTEAAEAWWNMLTQQFGQLAAATSASMGQVSRGDSTSRSSTPGSTASPSPSQTRAGSKKPRARINPKKTS